MGRSYTQLTLKQLYSSLGHFCPFPECSQRISDFTVDPPSLLGQIAHIVAASDDGPRANPSMPEKERHGFSNLILLCPSHHTLIDSRPDDYPVEEILKWKAEAQQRVHERLSIGASYVQFAQLKLICDAFADGDTKGLSTAMVAVAPIEKMAHNGLTSAIEPLMNIGLAQEPQVDAFIRKQAQLSSKFPDRLRNGFRAEYNRRISDGDLGDALFYGLINFAVKSVCSTDTTEDQEFIFRAASIAVICHLFLICEVFERP